MLALIFLLTGTATTGEPGGPRLTYEETREPLESMIRTYHVVSGQLELVDDVRWIPGSTVNVPGGAVYHDGSEISGYSVVHHSQGGRRELTWIEFYEVLGDHDEAERRTRNRVLSFVTLIGGPVLMAGGVLSARFVDSEKFRIGAATVAGVGLVTLILGFFTFDDPPERSEVAKMIEDYNARLSSE